MIWMHTWAKLRASQNVYVGLILLWLKSINTIWKINQIESIFNVKNQKQKG